jgi:hypothetical protein
VNAGDTRRFRSALCLVACVCTLVLWALADEANAQEETTTTTSEAPSTTTTTAPAPADDLAQEGNQAALALVVCLSLGVLTGVAIVRGR